MCVSSWNSLLCGASALGEQIALKGKEERALWLDRQACGGGASPLNCADYETITISRSTMSRAR
jgi:hypothetical protein